MVNKFNLLMDTVQFSLQCPLGLSGLYYDEMYSSVKVKDNILSIKSVSLW